jgi:hypothetical protein
MDYGYVGTGLAWKAQGNERNWEGFNGESYQLGNKEVYDAELFKIMVIFGRDLLSLSFHYSYLQVSLPLFNTFLILLHIIPSLCHPRRHAPLSHHPTLTHCRAAQRSPPQQ